MFAGDFDGDGVSDVLIHYANSSGKRTIRLHRGILNGYSLGTGIVTTTANNHNCVSYPCGIYVFDVNGDGRDDLVVKWKNGSYNRVYVYRGQQNGTFASAANTSTTTQFYLD